MKAKKIAVLTPSVMENLPIIVSRSGFEPSPLPRKKRAVKRKTGDGHHRRHEQAMFLSGIFQHETQHHRCDDFVGQVEETGSVINEGVKLNSHVNYRSSAEIEDGWGVIKLSKF